ncbi:MAG: hypothetical protein B7Y43_18630 [Sphingomonas sp. 28-62-20]|uniref:hypothetical protein n=1 Tax=Sphingomonas sp. 28-62-20 TaxID=1970433 RepID=UPI000BD5D642|nr:MAG: hypothetical protein B7Y43_18630 [Sphingomonas sp. 28-62-20]
MYRKIPKLIVMMGAVSFAAVAAATERTLIVRVGDVFHRIQAQDNIIGLVGRQEQTSLICVRVGSKLYWAKPEFWMTAIKTADMSPHQPNGTINGGGNGIGSVRELPVVSDEKCQ